MANGNKNALELFRWAAKNVAAYKNFLHKNGINPAKIKSLSDFAKVPAIDKKNYLRHYSFRDLLPGGKIPFMTSASSGSSGQPFYWPRSQEQEDRGAQMHEPIFRDIFKIGKDRTLVMICFSMGTWIAGTFTMASAQQLAQKGYNITVITPGIEREDALAALANFAPLFERVIICGYPPFVMDIISEANERKIPLNKFKLNMLFAGENFSEKWRDTIHEMAGINDPLHGSVSIYGTADAGMLGHENPLSIFIRRKALENKEFATAMFGDISFLPTMVQYYPDLIYFETVNGNIVFTTKSGIPLLRYNIGDMGRILTVENTEKILKEFGYFNLIKKELQSWQYPMIVLGGRSDVAVTFYALNIYPENIKAGLEDDRVAKQLTGKFVSYTKNINKERDQKLIIMIEMNRNVHLTSSLKELTKLCIFDNLIKLNAEYRKLYHSINHKALPQIQLLPFGDPIFKVRGSKHKWVKKN